MSNRLILAGLLLALFALKQNEAIQFKFTNFVCENFNKSWINVTECRLRAISRNVTNLYFNMTLLHPVNNVWVDMQIFKRETGYKPWLYKASIDGCRFLNKPYNVIAIIVYRMFKRHTNLNHSCPYEGHILVQNFNLDFGFLPHAIPTGDYLLKMDWIFTKALTLTTKHSYRFDEDLKAN